LIGAMSDRTWVPGLGRRRPYFLTGAIGCSLCLFAYPFCGALWIAVLLLWLLDASNNTAMEPYRAFIADKLHGTQLATGFLMQSFFTGFGITLANVSLYFFEKHITGQHPSGIPNWVVGSFWVGAFCSIGSVLVSILSTPEDPPTARQLEELRSKPAGFTAAISEIAHAIGDMPQTLWQLALVYLFQWYAMFVYWQYVSLSVAQSVWGATPANKEAYGQAVGWTGLINGFYNVVTFLSAFGLMWMAKRYAPKLVHACCVALAAVGLIIFPHITNPHLLFAPMIGFGIAWASMMGVPYLIAVREIPKERYGVYMGIINMMIVIPMLIETITFGWVYNHLLGADPGHAIRCAGFLLLTAAVATLMIRTPHGAKLSDEEVPVPVGGGH
jgi:maltose/moltooligosaccharide transporter